MKGIIENVTAGDYVPVLNIIRSSNDVQADEDNSTRFTIGMIRQASGRGTSRKISRGPSPLKVEAADPPVTVQHLTDHIQSRNQLGFHRSEIDFFERHTTRRHFGVIPSTVTLNGKLKSGQRLKQVLPLFAPKQCETFLRITSRVATKRSGQTFRDALRQRLQ